MNFIYCFDEKTKEKLVDNGYKFIKEVQLTNKIGYQFLNDIKNKKVNEIDKTKVLFSNKMFF